MSGLKSSILLLGALVAQGSASAVLPRQSVPDGFVAEPYYPTPHGGWDPDWVESYARAKEIVDEMTLAEKTNITSGSGWWMGKRCVGNTGSAHRVGFPQLCLGDSATGVNQADNVTAWPSGITTGATWDKDLIYQRGVAMGKEFRGKGVNIWLGPSVGPLGRKPKGGRNWEGFGSDPVLQGKASALSIKGVQEQGVIATIKHLIGNEQEMYRMYNPLQQGLSSNIDDRTLHEIYLWPFADGLRAGSGSVMTAYNAVNGSASVHNSHLINGILKNELGFQGFVMSDWFSHMSGVDSAIAGLDLNMPGDTQIPLFGYSYWHFELTQAVLNGSVPMDRLNDMTTRLVATWLKLGQDEDFPATNFHSWSDDAEGDFYPAAWPHSPKGVINEFVQVQDDHHLIAREVAQDAITMLKNNNSLLPISESRPIRVFGTAAQTNPDGPNACSFRSCNKGVLGMGWGSGVVDYMYIDDPISAISRRVDDVEYYDTDNFPSSVPDPDEDDVAFVFITSASGENSFTVDGNNGDRNSDGLHAWHGGDELVREAAETYSNVVVVVQTVGPILMEEWIDLPSVKSVLFQHLPGQEAGDALTNVVFGDVSPSGHLPYTITHNEDDLPESVTELTGGSLGQPQDTFSEGLYIDYRYLNKEGIASRFAFGHGLSYTDFTFGNASVASVNEFTELPPPPPSREPVPDFDQEVHAWEEGVAPQGFNKVFRYLYSWCTEEEARQAVQDRNNTYPYPEGYSTEQRDPMPASGGSGGNPALWDVMFTVSVTVTNAGEEHAGKASAQLYVQFPDDDEVPDTPVIQLRDFEKTAELAPGESELVTLELTRRDLSVWDVVQQNWVVPAPEGRYRFWVGDSSDRLSLACYSDSEDCDSDLESPV